MKHGVIFVMSASPNADVTWSAFLPFDLPAFVIEQGGYIGGRDVVGRVAAVSLGLFNVNDGMVDHQEMPSGANSRQKGALGIRGWGFEKRWVLRRHEIEPTRWQGRVEQTGIDPLHMSTNLLGGSGGALQCNRGDFERGDLPTSAGQPDGVGSFAAADVEGSTRLEVTYFSDQRFVGLTAPYLFRACVPFIPFSVLMGHSDTPEGGGAKSVLDLLTR